MRLRELGAAVGRGHPGPHNAITDVAGVRVGHVTLLEGEGPLVLGSGPVRTGVTAVLPHDGDVWREGLFAGFHSLNGCGEVTGMHWVRESGVLASPIGLTSTHGVGAVHEGLLRWAAGTRDFADLSTGYLPVVAETWDGALNDGFGMHIRPEHAIEAVEIASAGQVPEGCVGGGTGMICHGFKGGIGTASRRVKVRDAIYTVGVLVQANHGVRERFSVEGVPVGSHITDDEVPVPAEPEGLGSVIVVVATDAPLLPTQCNRLAQRAGLGVGRLGGLGENGSGDMFLAFSTGSPRIPLEYDINNAPSAIATQFLPHAHLDTLFEAVTEGTEESILNALTAATTMVGRDGVTAHAMPVERVLQLLGADDE